MDKAFTEALADVRSGGSPVVTDPAIVAAGDAEFSRKVREASKEATLQMLGMAPPPADRTDR